MKSSLLAVLAISLSSSVVEQPAIAQGVPQGGILREMGRASDGTITVYIRNELGEPLTVYPQIKLTVIGTGMSPPSPAQQTTGGGWVFSNLVAGQEFEIEIKADGYQTVHESTSLPNIEHASSDLIVFLKPLSQKNGLESPRGQFILAPRAAKEVQHGLNDLRSRKFDSARKHLEKALQMAPGNPYANYVMGMIYLVSQQAALAISYLEKSVSIDPKQPPSLLALGTARFQMGDYAGANEVLEQDVRLDATSWRADLMLAEIYLRQRNYEKAREYALAAQKNRKQNAAQAELVLGQALAGLGDKDEAASMFEDYLKLHPQDPNAVKIRNYADNLRKSAVIVATPVATRSGAGTVSPSDNSEATSRLPSEVPSPSPSVDLPRRENWAPPDVDLAKPFVISGAACSLPKVLKAAERKAVEFVTSLEQFTAVEEYQTVEIKRNEQLESPQTLKFSYVVTMDEPHAHLIQMHEIRNGSSGRGDMPGMLADIGAPALALAFHPIFQEDFEWKCEGLGEWKDRPTWVIHFEQRADRRTSLLAAYETPQQEFALPLKGRVWVSENGGEVLNLETDLVHPISEIGLVRQHFSIEYAPVTFQSHNVQLWLPESVDVYYQYRGHYFHNYHHFTNFKLFWVGTSEKMGKPKEVDPQQ